jgi:pimeloyl-ACP methyl ester carboxylesterase
MSASDGGHFNPLMHLLAARGHSCYAPDMPGFGGSYDLSFQPSSTRYYVDVYLSWLAELGVETCHVLGHHSGASLGTEIAALRPDMVLSLCVIGIGLMTAEEQKMWDGKANVPFNKPVDDGTHLMKTWRYLEGSGADAGGKEGLGVKDLDFKQAEFLKHARAWDGRCKIYTCVFRVDLMALFAEVTCPVLNMCSKEDVLWDLVRHVKEVVCSFDRNCCFWIHWLTESAVLEP